MRAKKAITRSKRNTGVKRRRGPNETDAESYRPSADYNVAVDRLVMIYQTELYRDKTISGYRAYFAEFIDIIEKVNLDAVTEDDFRRYITHLLNVRGLSPVTVNIRLSSVRAMFKRMLNEGIIEHNPAERIRKLKTDEQRIFTLTDDQVRRLFSVIDIDYFPAYRDYVAMLTMLKCGLRSNEINALEVRDIDFENSVIVLPGAKNKNRKTRMVPMTQQVRREISELIAEVREAFGEVTLVFTNQFGEPLRFDRIRKRMQIYAKKAGLVDEVRASPHSLRHTFAVNYLRNGGDLRSLQMILGHSDLATTQIYLDYSDDTVMEKFSEVEKRDKLNV